MKSRTPRRWLPYLIVLLILAAAAFVVGNLVAERQQASAQEISGVSSPDAPSGTFVCNIQQIMVNEAYFHVKCNPGVGSIVHFGYAIDSLEGSRDANRFLALLNTAYALNLPVGVGYVDSASSNPPGCGISDCRRLGGVWLLK